MTNTPARISFVVTVLLGISLLASGVRAQHFSGDSRNYFDYGEQFYTRVLQSADAHQVTARFSMASAMFSFLRSEKPQQRAKGEYYAIRDVFIEITQRGSPQTIASKNLIDTIYAQSFEQTTSKSLWHAMEITLSVPDADSSRPMTLRAEVRDGILARLAVRPYTKELRFRTFNPIAASASDSMAIGLADVTLYDYVDPLGSTALSHAKGISYPFSQDITGAFQVAIAPGANRSLKDLHGECILTQLSTITDPDDTTPKERLRVAIRSESILSNREYRLTANDSLLHYRFEPSDSSTSVNDSKPLIATVPFVLPGKKLEQGRYRLSIVLEMGGTSRHLTNDFLLVWPNMPISLDDPRDAINPLAHITTEAEYKDLQSGSRAELSRKLYTFWKKQDPTPETAFNERMAAFYQRVDYAYFNFATSHSLDGATTERGKIYILYGAPSKIERELLPGMPPVETWTYTNNVHRQFKFIDNGGRGDYKLVEMKNI